MQPARVRIGVQIVGLVQGRQGHQLVQLAQDLVIDQSGAGEMPTAMDDAMTGGLQLGAVQVMLDPIQHMAEQIVVGNMRIPLGIGQAFAVGSLGREGRCDADAFDLALVQQMRLRSVPANIERELDAGGTGIDNDNSVAHV